MAKLRVGCTCRIKTWPAIRRGTVRDDGRTSKRRPHTPLLFLHELSVSLSFSPSDTCEGCIEKQMLFFLLPLVSEYEVGAEGWRWVSWKWCYATTYGTKGNLKQRAKYSPRARTRGWNGQENLKCVELFPSQWRVTFSYLIYGTSARTWMPFWHVRE